MNGPVLLRRLPWALAVIAVVWCVWIGILISLTPRYSSPLVVVLIAPPIILASGVAFCARHRAPDFMAVGTVFFLGFAVVTGFSIGGEYHGPALLLGIATLIEAVLVLRERRREAAKT
jgi:hypothetical protein